jgi:hypothetical protein
MQYIVVEFLFQACSTVAIGFCIPYKLAYRRFISIRQLSIGHFRVLDAVDARTRFDQHLRIGGLSTVSSIAIIIRIRKGRSFGNLQDRLYIPGPVGFSFLLRMM